MISSSRMRAFGRLAAGIGLLAGASVPTGGAAVLAAPPGLDKLPAVDQLGGDTTTYLYRMGWDELGGRLQGTDSLQVIEHPEVQAFFEELKRLGSRHEQFASLSRFVLSALHRELVITAVDPIPVPPAAGGDETAKDAEDHQPAGVMDAAIITPGAKSKERLRSEFDAMMQTIGRWAGEVDTAEIAGVTFSVLGEEEDGIYTGWKGNRCLWAVGPQAARRVAEPARGAKLSESELFQATVGPLFKGRDGKPTALYYYDLRPGWRRLTADPQTAMAWSNLSWRSLDAVAGATFIEDGGYRNRHYWKIMPDLRTGLFKHSQQAKVNRDWLKRVPAEASGFTTGVWDPTSLILSMVGLFARTIGEEDMMEAAPMVTAPIAPLAKDMGPRYLVYRVPGKYGSFPIANALPLCNMVVIAELDSADTFEKNLDGMLQMIPGLQETTFNGHKIKVINVMYMTFYVAILEKELILTIHPQLMKDALIGLDKPGPSIVDTPAYKAARKYVLPDACFELYIEPGGLSRGIYDQHIPSLQQLISLAQGMGSFMGDDEKTPASAQGFNSILFPRGQAVAGHLTKATILSARDDGDGVLFDGYAPVISTPYWWVYVHALTQLHPGGGEGIFELAKFLVMPIETEEPAEDEEGDAGFAP